MRGFNHILRTITYIKQCNDNLTKRNYLMYKLVFLSIALFLFTGLLSASALVLVLFPKMGSVAVTLTLSMLVSFVAVMMKRT